MADGSGGSTDGAGTGEPFGALAAPDGADPAAVLGAAWRETFPWRFLTRLIEAGPRLGGSPGERRAADVVADAFAAAGAAPAYHAFEVARWERGSAELAVRAPRDGTTITRSFEAVALPYSPAGDCRAELVDVGYGTPDEIDDADVTGKIAVASTTTPPDRRFVHRMETFGHAAAAGAEAHLRVEAATEAGTSGNVVGALGPETDECVVLVGHYDAHDVAEGAMDNGCGIAVVATAAHLLARLADDLDRRVVVAGTGCEEVGLVGAGALADRLDLGSVAAVVNVDGAGRHRDLQAYTHGSDAVESLAREVVGDAGQPLAVEDEPHPYSDHWPFLRAGVPTLQLHSTGDGDDRGRGWGHTAADTRDKVDERNLRSHAMLTALLVAELTRADLPRVDGDDLRAELVEADAEAGMRAAGIWPDDWEG